MVEAVPRVVPPTASEAAAFVRFCYRRRRVGWPDLYDEMVAVANRRLYQGMGHGELAEIGIGFSLFETPRLAGIVAAVVSEELAHRARGLQPSTTTRVVGRIAREALVQPGGGAVATPVANDLVATAAEMDAVADAVADPASVAAPIGTVLRFAGSTG